MSWAKLDDAILDNPKIVRAGPIGFALHVAAITYCARNLTDGFVPYVQARNLLASQWTEDDGDRVRIQSLAMTCGMTGHDGQEVIEHIIDLLCSVGLWRQVPHGYEVHDYLKYNPSRDQVLADREAKREAGRVGGQQSVRTRRARYGTAQPEAPPEANAEASASRAAQADAEAPPEAGHRSRSQAAPKPVPVPPYPYPYPYPRA